MIKLAGRTMRGALAAMLIAGGSVHAFADDNYPNRTITMIVPFAAGGGSDTIARLLAPRMTDRLGQTVIVENHPGGSTIVGTQRVTSSPADGHTLLIATASLTINPTLRADALPYDTFEDLRPVALLQLTPYVIVARSTLGVSSVDELIDLATERPGELTVGSAGIASGSHLALEFFQSEADINLLHVPYSGTGPAMLDLVGGRVDLQFATPAAAQPHIEAGSIVPIAVTTELRSPVFPDVPSVSEFIPDFQTATWDGLLVPSGTPDAIVNRLNEVINEVISDESITNNIEELGSIVSSLSPEEMNNFLLEELERFSGIIEQTGVQAE